MKRNNKKGFTIVELVIVIAVIAILSAVLIPTFAGVTKKAKQSAALQTASNALTTILVVEDADLSDETFYIKYEADNTAYWYTVSGSKLTALTAAPDVASATAYTKASEDYADLATGVTVYKIVNA